MRLTFLPVRVLVVIAACLSGATLATAQYYPPPEPIETPQGNPASPPENPHSAEKEVLGKALFWDEQVSSDNTIACGTCHQPLSAGADPRPATHPGPDALIGTADDIAGSKGVRLMDRAGAPSPHLDFGFDRQVTRRSSSALTGAMFSPFLGWDGVSGGRFVDPETYQVLIAAGGALEVQASRAIMNETEMTRQARAWSDVRAKLTAVQPLAFAKDLTPDLSAALAGGRSYPDLFESAFGSREITAGRIAMALAAYQRSLAPNNTPWDFFVRGATAALTPDQTAGWRAFRGASCRGCHAGPGFTDNAFHNLGVRPLSEDSGGWPRFTSPTEAAAFKTPSLRNLGLKRTFMHNGGFDSLAKVIEFYRGRGNHQQFPALRSHSLPVTLADADIANIIDFLEHGLLDSRAASGLYPFDRPDLRSERPADPDLRLLRDAATLDLHVFPGDGDVPVSGFRAFVGTFPAATGQLRTLGTRGSGLAAAFDHQDVDCAVRGTTSDLSVLLQEPGSYYVLVSAVGDAGACSGLGRVCLPTAGREWNCSFPVPMASAACSTCAP